MGYHAGNDLNGVTTRIIRSNEAELVGIYEISKLLASPHQIEKTFASVLALLSSFLDMRDGLITLLDERGEPEVVIGPGCSEAGARQFFGIWRSRRFVGSSRRKRR
jgi:Nif-specific regulatory protein